MLLASARRSAGGVTGSSASSLPTSEILCEAGVPDCPASLVESASMRAMLPGRRLVLMLERAAGPDTLVSACALADTANPAAPAASPARDVVMAG